MQSILQVLSWDLKEAANRFFSVTRCEAITCSSIPKGVLQHLFPSLWEPSKLGLHSYNLPIECVGGMPFK